MPFFKTTYNILKTPDEDEAFDPKWMDSDKIILPPKKDWDYKREMQIEDVNLWEIIFDYGGGIGLYAAWDPYAEFFMLTYRGSIETFYGKGAQIRLKERLKELNLKYPQNLYWVDDEKMWLYE
jgi:hypothetical protein